MNLTVFMNTQLHSEYDKFYREEDVEFAIAENDRDKILGRSENVFATFEPNSD